MLMDDDLLKNEFLVESLENLASIDEDMTKYEKNSDDMEILNKIYRTVHTMKGSASFLGYKNLQDLTHNVENLLDQLRERNLALQSSMVDDILQSFDISRLMLKQIEENNTDEGIDFERCLNKIKVWLAEVSARGQASIKSIPEPVKEVVLPINEVKNESALKGSLKPAQGVRTSDSVIRVNASVLDKIMNTVERLILNRNKILEYSKQHESPEFNKLVQELNLITSELQTEVMSTRMQPVGNVLTKFERIIRDFARENDKKIELEIFGQEIELDKTLLEAIKDPLVHIVRNAADHGLEDRQTRIDAGKPEKGTVTIKVNNESGQVIVEIIDDGRGLNKKRILEKALEKGLLTPEHAETIGDQQIFMLIFAPGFSTAEKVTNISGRGVGMDVVKTNIEKLGGSISIHSEEGMGTTFQLKIPLTLV
jgi:two-component system chemotaxis sensor kinase CheA